MRTRILLLILFILNAAALTGCWDYRETDRLTIVAGMAVDKNEEGKYRLMIEIVNMLPGEKKTDISSKLLEIDGDTLLDAMRNSIKITAPKLYFGHMEIVVISQQVASEGVIDILDFLSRDPEPRLTIDLLLSKEKTAGEILNIQSITTLIRSYELHNMLDSEKFLAKSPKTQVYQFINDLSLKGTSPVLPCVLLTNSAGMKTSMLSGTAVFDEDKLAGFLEEEDTKYYYFIIDKIKGGLLILKRGSDQNSADISFDISENRTKVKPVFSDGRLSMDIETKTRLSLNEQSTSTAIMDEKERQLLEREAEQLIKTNIINVIQKVQRDFDIDVFGFGRIVNAELPSVWRTLGNDWKSVFKDLDINVKVKVEIRSSRLLSKSIKEEN